MRNKGGTYYYKLYRLEPPGSYFLNKEGAASADIKFSLFRSLTTGSVSDKPFLLEVVCLKEPEPVPLSPDCMFGEDRKSVV